MEETPKFFNLYEAKDLISALKFCLELRKDRFWSFRGQRNRRWDLGLHGNEKQTDLDSYFKEFRRRCKEFPPPNYIEEHKEWRWLFFAQHHRLKTRLLDWSKDPLVAIYFAVENIISRPIKNSTPGAVWALHVHSDHFKHEDELNTPSDEKEWIMVDPPPVTARLARQSGLFTFHPIKDCSKPLNKISRRSEEEELIKIVFKKGTKVDLIRRQLGILNIHHGSLFPDPQGIAEFVSKDWPYIALKEHLGQPKKCKKRSDKYE